MVLAHSREDFNGMATILPHHLVDRADDLGRVTFDGNVLVDGQSNHPTRPAPFIRTDEERTTTPGQ
jgi:hypothetical protein